MITNKARPIWAPSILMCAAFVVTLLVVLHALPVWGQTSRVLPGLAGGIHKLQPALRPSRAIVWERWIIDADREARIGDPWLIVSMVMAESSFLPSVAKGQRRGAKGEIGPLQTHGEALRSMPTDCNRRNPTPQCLLRTGVRWFAKVRETCPGSTWVAVGAYGMGKCPSERTARRMAFTKKRWSYYQTIRPGVGWDS